MKENLKILSTVSIYHALTDGSICVISILFPIFKSMFNLSYTQVGVITGGGLLITLVAQLLIGRAADGKNFNFLLSIGVLLTSISLLLLTQSRGFLMLVLFIFVMRFSTSFFHPIGVGWVSRIYKKDKLDWAMGIQSGSADLGSFIAIATTLYIAESNHWTLPLYIWMIFGIIGLLVTFLLTRNIDREYMIVKKQSKKQGLKETAKEAFRLMSKIKLLLPAFMISGASWGIVITYLPLLLNEKTDLSLPVIGLVVAIWIGIGSISSLSYGKIRSHVDRKKILIFSYLTIGVTGLCLAYFTNIFIIIPIIILLGISIFLTYPALFSFVSEVTDESSESWTFGLTFTFQTGGGTILLFSGGILSDLFGIWMPFALIGVLSLIMTFLLVVYRKKPLATST